MTHTTEYLRRTTPARQGRKGIIRAIAPKHSAGTYAWPFDGDIRRVDFQRVSTMHPAKRVQDWRAAGYDVQLHIVGVDKP